MAHNNYQQNYRQRPPPQHEYRDDYYDQGNYYDGQQDQPYNQRNHGYGEYHDKNYDESNYHYDTYQGQRHQWGDEQYRNPQYQDQRSQRSQYDNAPRQQRSHQYDDRYRMNSSGRPPLSSVQGRPPPRNLNARQPPQHEFENMTRGDNSNNYGDDEAKHRKVVRERILRPEPESPKTSAWDNPFPTFPTKKKQNESKNSEGTDQSRKESFTGDQSLDGQRPSTSHSNKQRNPPPNIEVPRPHTSQSQRNINHPLTPSHVPPIPNQNGPPGPLSLTNFHDELPVNGTRPLPPRRAMTGPNPEQRLDGYNRDELHQRRPNEGIDKRSFGERQPLGYSNQREYKGPPLQGYPDDQEFSGGSSAVVNGNAPRNRDDHPQQQQMQPLRKPLRTQSDEYHHELNVSNQREERPHQVYDGAASYRGVPFGQKTSPDMPNFDLIPQSNAQLVEDHLGPSQQQQHSVAYQKPTYQTAPMTQPAPYRQQSIDGVEDLATPLAHFSFNLDPRSPGQPQKLPQASTYHDNQSWPIPQQHGPLGGKMPPGSGTSIQHPQRGASRPQEASTMSPQGYQGNRPPPFRPGHNQPPLANPNSGSDFQVYDHDHEFDNPEYAQDDGYNRPLMPPSQASYENAPSRHGYDQRIQPRSENTPPQGPPRPLTSNSSRNVPATGSGYGHRSSSDKYQYAGMQNPDSLPAHPAPFRPGLMQQTPPPPRPTPPPQPHQQPQLQNQPHQRVLSSTMPPVASEAPVTIRELNNIREQYKNRPNDYALGLRFAKRLVEAAKVLSNENGKADPKQTAKNRERYILDAHKIVKRLCGSNYPDAMFYLADCYGQGMLGLEVDPKEAFSLYQSAAKLGHAQAAYRVAVCCELGAEEGGGTKRDPLKAVQWYKRAASLGDTPAMYKMGMILLKGLLGQSKSPREAISWLKRAAERADEENPHALHELGLLYESAQSTDIILKDEQYALQLFQQAAELGYKYSQFRLGSAYEYGLLGLPIDPRMSIAWYSKAAKQGEHQSEFALSGWYLTGSGQPPSGEQPLLQQSDTEAYLWARKAASSGLAKAEYAMGYYTEVGIGVTSNIEEAKRWYYRAAAQNHPKARERLEDLKRGGQRMQKTRVSRSNVGKHNEGECVVM